MRGKLHCRRAGGGVDGWLAWNSSNGRDGDECPSNGNERELRTAGVGVENEGRVRGVGTGEDGGVH